ncbi:methyl-accepting chemotaxis protein [Virgibacillus sp. L01]|uniref:methyl-accepting chemotaxis protein n=1 Tax=Virgibacillus sp. L01 TaxID=3457429 RepID=UPI003FD23F9F
MKKGLNFKRLRTKILLGFSIIIVLVLLLGVYNMYTTTKANKEMKEITDHQLALLITDEKLAVDMVERTSLLRGYLLYDDVKYKNEFKEGLEESIALEEKVLELSNSEQAQELVDKKFEWGTLTDKVFAEYDSGNEEVAMQIMEEEVQPLADELAVGFQNMASKREAIIDEMGQEVISNGETSLFIGIAITILVMVLGILIAILTSRSITNPISTVMERMKVITNGDLSQEPLETRSIDEIGQLIVATNEMNTNMRELLNQINEVSETVSSQSEELTQSASEVKSGAEQIATTMQELASGSETQANTSSELSSVMGNFANKVQEANENGEHIQKSSNEVLEMTDEGSELMNSSNEQMAKIDSIVQDAVQKVQGLDTQSQEISKLVSVIKDIADQTNLLALNAAIEAARAGEHGKGFAVVADEVRKLAEQVSISVTDITDIVTNIQNESSVVTDSLQGGYKEVEQGTAQIRSTGEKFSGISNGITEVVSSIKTVTDNLSEIAANSQQMNGSIQEIAAVSEESSAGIEQTSASSQQTSSSMEEVAGSSDDLARLAEKLNGLVRKFKL